MLFYLHNETCSTVSALRGRHRRGEALPKNLDLDAEQPRWHILWTHSNCEQLVHDQLSAKGFELFLPRLGRWSRRKGARYLAKVPMFPGYLFLRHAMSKTSYIEVCKSKGLVRILGERWDRLGTVPDGEIAGIQKVLEAGLPVMPYPYTHLCEGQRVRITRGPLANVEGVVVKPEPKKGLLLLSVELLRQCVAVQIDCTLVAAA
jgi:transcription termination/antitermination protein NusG